MQTRTALKRLSKGQIDVDRVSPGGPLSQNAQWLLDFHSKREAEIKATQQRHDIAAAMPAMEAARAKLGEMLRDRVMPEDTPIVSRFDAFSVIKDASKQNKNDQSLRKLALHLERLWHKEPLGTLTVGALSRLRTHYQDMSPRSVVGEVVDTAIPKVSFKTLPVAKLTRVAAQINTQQDYDEAVVRNCLQGNDPISVRARTFICELVNRKSAAQSIPGVKPLAEAKTQSVGGVSDGPALSKRKRSTADRVIDRIQKEAQEAAPKKECTSDMEAEVEAESTDTQAAMGVEGTGMLQIAEVLKAQDEMYRWASTTGEGLPKVAVAPPGWENTVKEMKGKKDVDNPFALAWYMHGKGNKPHSKKSAKEDKKDVGGAEFEVKVNEQQDDQVKVPNDGGKALKTAVSASNPMVDDGMDHFPIHTPELAKLASESIKKVDKVPEWWLGSVKELVAAVESGIKEAGKLPPALEKFKKQPKGKGEKKEDKKPKFAHTQEAVEEKLLAGVPYHAAGLSIKVDSDDTLAIVTKKGSKKYAMFDMDSAIKDFLYLVGTEKQPIAPPPPMFTVREGMRFICPGCGETNSYAMPKTAADLTCGSCDVIIPSRVIASAFDIGAAADEAVLVVYTPVPSQDEFGEKLVKAAEIIGADSAGSSGCKAEVYAKDVSVEKLAEVWDYMVEAGFQPIAQSGAPSPSMPSASPIAAEGEDEMPTEMPEEPGMAPEAPMGTPDAMPGMEMGTGSPQWADTQVIQAAMMHYQHQGMDALDALVQFKKDYATEQKDEAGEPVPAQEFDPMAVLQVAAQVFGIDLAQLQGQDYEMGALAKKAQSDIPTPGKINQQQPDAVQPGKLGPDSDNKDPGSYGAGKPKSQRGSPQGTFSETSTEPDSDNRDPGKFKAPAPKVNHPPTDQAGVSLPAKGLGPDSDTGDNSVTRKMETVSKQAPHSMRSAQRGILDGVSSFKKQAQTDRNEAYNLAMQAVGESKLDPKISDYLESIALEWQGANADILQQLMDKQVSQEYLLGYSVAQMIMGRPDVYKQVKKMVEKSTSYTKGKTPATPPAAAPAAPQAAPAAPQAAPAAPVQQ
jgi:hypothetical protein